MVSHSEGTDRVADPYRCCYKYQHTIVSLKDHPAITGEWAGESLADLGEQYKNEISTAAGRYQINRRIWEDAKRTLSLPDFGAVSQDATAAWLIKDRGALGLVNTGQIAAAIERCSGIWASLPGKNNVSGQPQKTVAGLLDYYTRHGGGFA